MSVAARGARFGLLIAPVRVRYLSRDVVVRAALKPRVEREFKKGKLMRHLGILLLGSIAIAACASTNNTPPAASSDSVAQATSQPNTGPDYTPAASDGVATANVETTRAHNATQPAPMLNAPATDTAPKTGSTAAAGTATGNGSTNSQNGAWATGSNDNSGVDHSTGNAAAAPADRSAHTDADNSRVNKRDKNDSALTPMDQGGSEADRKITQQIRQDLMKDKSLSFTAKNVKVITINGKVTLRGPVKSEAERTAIEAAARRAAGSGGAVDSQLELSK